MPSRPPPSLAAGERPVTGVTRYDRLFADVNASLVAIREARDEEAEARGALARRLGLTEAAPIELLGTRLRERTVRLAHDGLTLELEFTGIDDVEGLEAPIDANAEAAREPSAGAADDVPEVLPPTATLRTPSREPQRRELRLLEALAQAALSGATVYANMGRERRHIERLLAEVVELEGRVDSSFVEPSDRERVRDKLGEAKVLLPQLDSQARDVSGAADILISLLDEAANTAPVVPGRRRAPGPPKDGPRPAPAPAPRPEPAKPPAPALAPTPSSAAPRVAPLASALPASGGAPAVVTPAPSNPSATGPASSGTP
jgi:hypothetical protein